MAAPAFYVDWDTNGINQVAVTSGHASNGFVTNEVPTSAELNKWMNGVGLWVRYFAGLFAASVPLNIDIASGVAVDSSGGLGTGISTFYLQQSGSLPRSLYRKSGDSTGAGWVDFPVPIASGVTITHITAGYKRSSGGSLSFQLFSVGQDGTTTSLVSKTDSVSSTNTTMDLASAPNTGSLPQTTDSTHSYFIRAGLGATDQVYSLQVQYTQPA